MAAGFGLLLPITWDQTAAVGGCCCTWRPVGGHVDRHLKCSFASSKLLLKGSQWKFPLLNEWISFFFARSPLTQLKGWIVSAETNILSLKYFQWNWFQHFLTDCPSDWLETTHPKMQHARHLAALTVLQRLCRLVSKLVSSWSSVMSRSWWKRQAGSLCTITQIKLPLFETLNAIWGGRGKVEFNLQQGWGGGGITDGWKQRANLH